MSENTKIEWATHTFNPWVGCTKISPACDNCYAEGWAKRSGQVVWGGERKRTSVANWKLPLKWDKHAALMQSGWAQGVALHGGDEAACIAAGYIKPVRPKVFCASLADVFDNAVSVQWRFDLLGLIADTPNLDWLILTKRIGNAAYMLNQAFRAVHGHYKLWANNVLPNVWLGATICNQTEADRDIPKLLAIPAHKRFLSIEPMVGPVDLSNWFAANDLHEIDGGPRLNWVIVGGESGPNARPMHPDWARSLRDQCEAAGVPFLFKQWGEWGNDGRIPMLVSIHEKSHSLTLDGKKWDGPSQCCPRGTAAMLRVGKKAAGRLLDGREWNGVPV